MPLDPAHTFTADGLQPLYDPSQAKLHHVRLPASITYPKGQILGQVIGNNEVQSITVDATGGTFTITAGEATTGNIAFNASAAAVQAALEALAPIGAGNVRVQKVLNRYTLTHTSGTDGGTFALKVTVNGVSRITSALAWNISAANLTAALVALENVGTAGAVATGSDGGPYLLTFVATLGEIEVAVVNDLTADDGVIEGGVVLAQQANPVYLITFRNALGYTNVAAVTTTATNLTGGEQTAVVATVTGGSAGTAGVFRAYDPAGSDGRQVARAILQYAAATDSDGLIMGPGGENGEKTETTPAYFSGTFATEDLTGLDEAAVDQLGRLIAGNLASGGVIRLG